MQSICNVLNVATLIGVNAAAMQAFLSFNWSTGRPPKHRITVPNASCHSMTCITGGQRNLITE